MVEGGLDGEPFILQKALQQGHESLVVVNDEHALHAIHSARSRIGRL